MNEALMYCPVFREEYLADLVNRLTNREDDVHVGVEKQRGGKAAIVLISYDTDEVEVALTFGTEEEAREFSDELYSRMSVEAYGVDTLRAEQANKGVVFIVGEDWVGIYVDGELKYEDHSISEARLLDVLGIPYQMYSVNEEWLEEVCDLPRQLRYVVPAEE